MIGAVFLCLAGFTIMDMDFDVYVKRLKDRKGGRRNADDN